MLKKLRVLFAVVMGAVITFYFLDPDFVTIKLSIL